MSASREAFHSAVWHHVGIQSQRVLTDFDGGAYNAPVAKKFPVRIEPGRHFTMTIESAAAGIEWGVNAFVLRRKQT